MATRGSYVHNFMAEFSGASQKCLIVLCNFLKYWWFQTKLTGLLELVQLYKQITLEKIFILTVYQNYTLALTLRIGVDEFNQRCQQTRLG